MVKVKRVAEPHPPPYYDLDGYYLSLASSGTAKTYEEGTWTPTVTFGGASTGLTYSTQVGTWTRIGRIYHIQGRIQLSAKGSSTGTAAIGGNSFSAPTPCPLAIGRLSNFSGLTGSLYLYVFGTGIAIRQSAAAGDAVLTDANFTNTTDFSFSGVMYV